MTGLPAWVRAVWRGRGLCEACGAEPAASEWAGTGEVIGWACVARRQAAAVERLRRAGFDVAE